MSGPSAEGYSLVPLTDPATPALLPEDTCASSRQVYGSSCRHQEKSTRSVSKLFPDEEVSSFCACVEDSWFQVVAAVLVIINIACMVLEAKDPVYARIFHYVDVTIFCFYVLELLLRLAHFQSKFLCGPWTFVVWNVVDIIIILAGAVEWYVTQVFGDSSKKDMRKSQLTIWAFVRAARMARALRALKMVRVILEADLSWTEGNHFQAFIGVVIFLNALLMGAETDMPWVGWAYIEQVLLTVYVFELVAGFKRDGLFFLSCNNSNLGWNLLDFLIVVSSTLDTWGMPLFQLFVRSMGHHEQAASPDSQEGRMKRVGSLVMLVRSLRLLRVLRLVRLIKSVRPLYILVTGVLAALQGVFWVLVLTVTVLYGMGIMATRLIGHGMIFQDGHVPDDVLFPFETVPDSMFTLFRVMSGADSAEEAMAMETLMADVPALKFAFVYFMVTSSWTLLSILTAVVSETMISVTSAEERALRIAQEEETRLEQMEELRQVFSAMDRTRDGIIQENEFSSFLRDKTNAATAARACRSSVRTVRDVMHALNMYGREVTLDGFVEQLVDAGQPVTEKSVLKLEARFECMLDRVGAELRRELREHQAGLGGRLAEDLLAQAKRQELGLQGVARSVAALQDAVLRSTLGPTPGKLAPSDDLRAALEQRHLETLSAVDALQRELGVARLDASRQSRQLEASVARLEAAVARRLPSAPRAAPAHADGDAEAIAASCAPGDGPPSAPEIFPAASLERSVPGASAPRTFHS